MSDSDGDELAALRAARAAKTGELSLTAQRERAAAAARPPAAPAADDGDDSAAEAALRAHLPLSFGGAPAAPSAPPADAHAARKRARSADDEDDVGPPRPRLNDEDGDEAAAPLPTTTTAPDPYRLPITHEAALQATPRGVATLALDRAGARLAAGTRGGDLLLFDFHGMKSDAAPFRTLVPCEGVPVTGVAWSPTGDRLVAAVGDPRLFFYDRDGRTAGETPRGDMYIRDAAHTRGHVAGVTCVAWHPSESDVVASGSEDGTVRVWRAAAGTDPAQTCVIKPALPRPGRVAVTAIAYAGERHEYLVAGLADGSLHAWPLTSIDRARAATAGVVHHHRAQGLAKADWKQVTGGGAVARGAHGDRVTCVAAVRGGAAVATRSTDGTLKIWDVRNLTRPVITVSDLPCTADTAGAAWSPDGRLVLIGCCGSSVPKNNAQPTDPSGAIAVVDVAQGAVVRRVGVPGDAVPVAWPGRLNQIFVGTATPRGGRVRALYDPARSRGGVVDAVGRRPRPPSDVDFALPTVVVAPAAERRGRGRGRGGGAAATSTSTAPARAKGTSMGFGSGGALGAGGGTLLTQAVLKARGGLRPATDEDIVGDLRKSTGRDDAFAAYTAAYKATQPERVFAEEEEEGEEGGG